MLMLRSCLATASREFVAYVHRDLTPLITRFHSKGSSGNYRGLHQAAEKLLGVLRDETDSPSKELDPNEYQCCEKRDDNNRGNISKDRSLHIQVHSNITKVQHHDQRDKPHPTPAPKELPLTPPRTPSSRADTDRSIKAVTPQPLGPTGLLTPVGSPVAQDTRVVSGSRPTSIMSTL